LLTQRVERLIETPFLIVIFKIVLETITIIVIVSFLRFILGICLRRNGGGPGCVLRCFTLCFNILPLHCLFTVTIIIHKVTRAIAVHPRDPCGEDLVPSSMKSVDLFANTEDKAGFITRSPDAIPCNGIFRVAISIQQCIDPIAVRRHNTGGKPMGQTVMPGFYLLAYAK
jgi:hypothetical protein